MTRLRYIFLSFILVLIFAQGCASNNAPTPANEIRAGLAEIDITPPVGYRMAGYFDERFSTGIHDPLKAKAIVLQNGKTEIAMVFCDIVGISLNVSTNARAKASRETGIPYSNIIISATHSHTGPLFDDVRRDYFHKTAIAEHGVDPHEKIHYPDFLAAKVVEAIIAARKNVKPSTLKMGIGKEETISFNRRYRMKDGRVQFNPGQMNTNIVEPAGPRDPDVGILSLYPKDSPTPIGGLTVFAMHADTVGGTEFSADYLYYLEQYLRSSLGKDYVSAFAAGTCGDINHINVAKIEPVKGFEVAERLGTTLAKSVLAANLQSITQPSFKVQSATVTVPLKTVTPAQIEEANRKVATLADSSTAFMTKVESVRILDIAARGTSLQLEVQVIRLDDDRAIVALPCELFAELGLAIKKASPFKQTIVMAICNDRPTYVPTRKAFAEGSYEVTNSRVTAECGEILVATAVKLLNEVKQ